MDNSPNNSKIGYVLNAFPVLSETFILNELRAMARNKIPIVILSLARPPEGAGHASVQELSYRRLYGPERSLRGLLTLLCAHASIALRHPHRYGLTFHREVGRHFGLSISRGSAPQRRRLRKRVRLFVLGGWVAHAAKREGIRHLHAHYARIPLEVAEVARRLVGVSYSFAAHAKDLYTTPPERLSRRLRRARFAVACHSAGAEYLRTLAHPEDRAKILQVSHGLDTRLFRPRAWERDPELILAVGRLTPKKGFDDLVRALGLLDAGGVSFRCEILGQGRMRRELLASIDRLGLAEKVKIRGMVPQEQLAKWYARASIVVMPSRVMDDGNRDGIPNVVLEAMACATPVVGTRAGGIPEVISDRETGLLVPPQEPASLAASLGELLANPAYARRLGSRAAIQVADLDFSQTNRALAERLKTLSSAAVTAVLQRVSDDAWNKGGVAERAAARLGRRPRHSSRIEGAIARAVTPGVAANAWRPDLERLVARRLWDEYFKARLLPRVKSALNGNAELGGAVLDLGCGRGGLAVGLRVQGVKVVGLDLRYRNCRVSGLRAERYGLTLPAVASHGERLPFPDGHFQAVSCLEVLEHVIDPIALLREIRRVLAPDGACVITVINRLAHLDPHYQLWGINFLPRKAADRYIRLRKRAKESYRDCQTLEEMHYYTYRTFQRLARSLGFEVEDPETPSSALPGALHHLRRFVSVGFNSAMVVLRPS